MLIGCFHIIPRSRRLPRRFAPRNDSGFRQLVALIETKQQSAIREYSPSFFTVKITKYIAFYLAMCYNSKLTDYEVLRCTKETFLWHLRRKSAI